MWNLKCKIIAVIIVATGIVTKSLKKIFETIIYHTFNKFTTKDNYTRTSRIIRKVLQPET